MKRAQPDPPSPPPFQRDVLADEIDDIDAVENLPLFLLKIAHRCVVPVLEDRLSHPYVEPPGDGPGILLQ